MIRQYRWTGPQSASTPWTTDYDAAQRTLWIHAAGTVESRAIAGCHACGATDPALSSSRCGGSRSPHASWQIDPSATMAANEALDQVKVSYVADQHAGRSHSSELWAWAARCLRRAGVVHATSEQARNWALNDRRLDQEHAHSARSDGNG